VTNAGHRECAVQVGADHTCRTTRPPGPPPGSLLSMPPVNWTGPRQKVRTPERRRRPSSPSARRAHHCPSTFQYSHTGTGDHCRQSTPPQSTGTPLPPLPLRLRHTPAGCLVGQPCGRPGPRGTSARCRSSRSRAKSPIVRGLTSPGGTAADMPAFRHPTELARGFRGTPRGRRPSFHAGEVGLPGGEVSPMRNATCGGREPCFGSGPGDRRRPWL